MKSEKGVSLISVTVYVIVMVLLVAVISIITNYFYKNINLNTEHEDTNKQYTKFVSYFSEEVNIKGNEILEIQTNENEPGKKVSYVIFSTGNQYTFMQENKAIYVGQVKIASNIADCEFSQISDTSIEVNMQLDINGDGNAEITRTNTFNLKK